jgi:hypothetical protein
VCLLCRHILLRSNFQVHFENSMLFYKSGICLLLSTVPEKPLPQTQGGGRVAMCARSRNPNLRQFFLPPVFFLSFLEKSKQIRKHSEK